MVGLLGCGCCSYCGGVYIGSFSDEFNPPFAQDTPASDIWSVAPPPFGVFSTFIGWYQWKYNIFDYYPWHRVPTTGKFLPFILGRWNLFPGSYYWASEFGADGNSDKCVYSANYRLAKYTTEITVSLPIAKAPAVQEGTSFRTVERPQTGPNFIFSGPWSYEKETTGRLFGPRICIGLRTQLGNALPWQHYWVVLDKYTTSIDAAYGNYINGGDNFLPAKDTYRLGIEIECINRDQYRIAPGPIFQGTVFIDGRQVYTNTYGPFVDNGAASLGGANNWRPNGHCRCMFAGNVYGRTNLHPIQAYNLTTKTVGWTSDVTESFWADDFVFTETYL